MPVLLATAAIVLGMFGRGLLYTWICTPLWFTVNLMVMFYPFTVLYPHTEPR